MFKKIIVLMFVFMLIGTVAFATTVEKDCNHTKGVEKYTAPTCTEWGSQSFWCPECNFEKMMMLKPLGHKYVTDIVKHPTCVESGLVWHKCERCGDFKEENLTAKGHDYDWVIAKNPTDTEHGAKEYKCVACGHVAKTEVIRRTKYYRNNTMCSFGPTTRELIGGDDWYRVTPIDVTVDGTYTYDLIASNLYVIGTVDIVVSNGVLIVNYNIEAGNVSIKEELLQLYSSKNDMKKHVAVEAEIGAEINLVETFGDDNVIIVSLILTGDYDAAHYKVKAMEIDEDIINNMIKIID